MKFWWNDMEEQKYSTKTCPTATLPTINPTRTGLGLNLGIHGRRYVTSIHTEINSLNNFQRNWIQHLNRMPRNRLPRVMKCCSPTGRRNHGRPLKRLLDTWDRNGSTSGPTPWQIYDDDDDDDFHVTTTCSPPVSHSVNSYIRCEMKLRGVV